MENSAVGVLNPPYGSIVSLYIMWLHPGHVQITLTARDTPRPPRRLFPSDSSDFVAVTYRPLRKRAKFHCNSSC